MARPIKPTPVLKGKNADRFLKSVTENVNKPIKPVMPCLKAAQKAVFADAISCQK